MKKDYELEFILAGLCFVGFLIGLAFALTAISPRYPEPPRFTEKIENANSIKVLAVDGDFYWVVQEKIGQRTYNIILKPVGKTLEKEGEI
jgi:hypothetical protein